MLRPWSKPAPPPPRVFCLLYTCSYPTDLLEKQPYNRAQYTHLHTDYTTYVLASLLSTFCILSSSSSSFFLLLLLSFFFFLYSPCPPFTHTLARLFCRVLVSDNNLPAHHEPSWLWLPSTLTLRRAVPSEARSRYRFVENLLHHLATHPPLHPPFHPPCLSCATNRQKSV